MFKHRQNIYTSFKPNTNFPAAEDKIRSLIMGHCGSGKTHFLNNACNKDYMIGFSKGSLTKDIVYEDVSYFPEGKFRIYDTPGSNSSQKAYEHAMVVKACLTTLPLNLIIIQAKFDCRYGNTINQLRYQKNIFKGYESLVIFLISGIDLLDTCPDKEKIIKQLGQTIERYKIKAKVILYSNLNSDFGDLTKLLYKIGAQNKLTKVEINDDIFHEYFNLSSPLKGLHSDEIQNYYEQIKKIAQSFIRFSKGVQRTNPQRNEILSQLKVYMKYYLKDLQIKQYEIYSEDFDNEVQTTDLFLMISQYIMSKLEEFDHIADMDIMKKFSEEKNEQQFDIRDLLKSCPQCDMILMRVEGCPYTKCGKKTHFQNNTFNKYDFNFKNGQLVFTKNQKAKIEASKMIKIEQKNISKKNQLLDCQILDGKDGCGKLLKWDSLPRLPNIQAILKQLYGTSNLEEIKLQIDELNTNKKKTKLDQIKI